jgi:hypothetical protein
MLSTVTSEDIIRCRCGRHLPEAATEGICRSCLDRLLRRKWWEHASDFDRVQAAARIGVHARFCQHGKIPSFFNPGLFERLDANPLPVGGILAVGPNGTHKTHFLAARTCNAAKRGETARLINWGRFCLEVRATYKSNSPQTELGICDKYVALDYLAIDDLGVGKLEYQTGKETEAARVLCYELLNERYARDLTTDISSNCRPDGLEQRFDARIGYRIREMCTVYKMLLKEGESDD